MGKKAKILLVEDDLLMARMYQEKFKRDGYEVFVASDGEEGLKVLEEIYEEKKLPDIILLDIMMPKMNGFDMLSILKKDPRFKKIPVVLLTNLAGNPKDEERGKKLGALDYWVKSEFTPREIVEKVQKLLQSR